MNLLYNNYKTYVIRAVDGATVDGNISMGLRMDMKRRIKLNGVELPKYDSKNPDTKDLLEAARTCLDATVTGRRVCLSTTRPNMHGRVIGRMYIHCRKASFHHPNLTRKIGGHWFMDVVVLMNLAAEYRFDLEFLKTALEPLELEDA